MMKLFVFYQITNTKRSRTSKKVHSITDLPAAMSNMFKKGKQV